jgi:hypothetical protein
MLGGPTSSTAPGTTERGAMTGWRSPHVAPAANRATMWSRLHHHQHHDVKTSLSSSTRPAGPAYKRGNTARPRGPLPLCLFISLSLSHVPEILPLVYKREGWVPHLKRRRTSTPLHLHQRLGTSSLSRQFVSPTANFNAANTSDLEPDVGTLCPNQYTSLCPPAHHPGQTRNINLPIGGSKRQQLAYQVGAFCALRRPHSGHGWLATA